MRKISLIRIVELLVILSLVCSCAPDGPAQQTNFPKVKEYRIERSIPPAGGRLYRVSSRHHTGVVHRLGQKPTCQRQYILPGLPFGAARRYGYRQGT